MVVDDVKAEGEAEGEAEDGWAEEGWDKASAK